MATSPIFFTANRPYQIVEIVERHEATATGTIYVAKVPSGTAPASGTNTMNQGFSLATAINTNQKATRGSTTVFINSNSTSVLEAGDSLCLITTGSTAGLTNSSVSTLLRAI